MPKRPKNSWRHQLGCLPGFVRSFFSRLSIVYKVALASSVVLIMAVTTLVMVVANFQTQLLNRQIDALGNLIATQFSSSVTESLFIDDLMALQVQVFNLVKDPRVGGAAIIDANGQVLAKAGKIVITLPEGGALTGERDSLIRQGNITVTRPVAFNGVEAGHVLVDFIPLEVSRSFELMLKTVVTLAVATVLILLAVAFTISRRLSQPINDLVGATERIGQGDYRTQLTLSRQDELGKIAEAINKMSQGLLQKQRIESLLNRVVATEVAETLLSEQTDIPVASRKVDASVLFVDIVSFTSMAEKRTPEEVVSLLNEYFDYFTLCGQLFFGCVDKFIGDCAMLLFGTPKTNIDHRFNAVACAVVIQRLMKEINSRRQARGDELLQVRIGINSGDMMAGTVGAQQRMEYTVVGDAVNLASRLTALAAPDAILVAESVVNDPTVAARVQFEPKGEVTVKGKRDVVRVVQITGINPEYGRVMDDLIDDILSSFPLSSPEPVN